MWFSLIVIMLYLFKCSFSLDYSTSQDYFYSYTVCNPTLKPVLVIEIIVNYVKATSKNAYKSEVLVLKIYTVPKFLPVQSPMQ